MTWLGYVVSDTLAEHNVETKNRLINVDFDIRSYSKAEYKMCFFFHLVFVLDIFVHICLLWRYLAWYLFLTFFSTVRMSMKKMLSARALEPRLDFE